MVCAECKYWMGKTQKSETLDAGLIHFVTRLGICSNPQTINQIHLIPNDKAVNIISHATIETDEYFGCIHYEPVDH